MAIGALVQPEPVTSTLPAGMDPTRVEEISAASDQEKGQTDTHAAVALAPIITVAGVWLPSTGGVITPAGVRLAVVFTALAVRLGWYLLVAPQGARCHLSAYQLHQLVHDLRSGNLQSLPATNPQFNNAVCKRAPQHRNKRHAQ